MSPFSAALQTCGEERLVDGEIEMSERKRTLTLDYTP